MEISAELRNAAEGLGQQFACCSALHPDDHLMAYVINYSQRSVERGPSGGLSEFFEHGASDAQKIKDITTRLKISPGCAVLEFACGYGRVSRHLSGYFQNFTCADIHTEAVAFLRDQMKLDAIASAQSPCDFKPGKTFDFIFVLSLFSHLPAHLFSAWLGRLYGLLNRGGILMFTTHGDFAAEKQPLLAQNLDYVRGFGFLETSDQSDLDPSVYGSSTALPHFVRREIELKTQGVARIIDFSRGAWWDLQDQWIIQKPYIDARLTSLACD